MTKDEAINKIYRLIEDAEESYELGGSEDENGAVQPGFVDFEVLRKKLIDLINKLE